MIIKTSYRMKMIALVVLLFNATSLLAQVDSLPSHVYNLDSIEGKKQDSRVLKQLMDGSTTSLANFEVHTTTLEPGKSPHPAHTHSDADELIIIKEGLLKVTIKDSTMVLGPGSIAFIMPGDEHGFENAGSTTASYYVFKYKSKLPQNMDRAKQAGGSFMLNWKDLPIVKTDKGGRREFFNRPTSQLGKFEMHTTMLNKGMVSHDQHRHTEEEIILVIRGNTEMHIANSFQSASAGDLVFLSSGVLHALRNTGDGPCEYFAFQWKQ